MRWLSVAICSVVVVACGSDGQSSGSNGGAGGEAGSGGQAGAGGGPAQLCLDACDVFQTCDAELDVDACTTQCDLEVKGEGYLSLELAQRFFGDVVATGSDTGCDLTRSNRWWVVLTETSGYTGTFEDQRTFDACRAATVCERTEPALSENCLLHYYRYNDQLREDAFGCFALCSPTEPWACLDSKLPAGQPWIAGVSPWNP